MINKVILVGNLGKDPELRYTTSGTAVCSFSMATSESFKDKNGERQDRSEWHNIVVWSQLAELCGKYLAKGKKIYLEGKIQTRSYDDRDGLKKYITEIVARDIKFLSPANESQAPRQEPERQEPPAFDPNDEIPF